MAEGGGDGGGTGASPSRGGGGVPAKPALKRDTSNNKKKRAPKSAGERKHLKWDEPTIEEHDQLRGTRMKIDEPNTPYTHYDSGAESDDSRRCKSPANQRPTLSWDTLQTRLDSVAAVREQYPPGSPSSASASGGHAESTDQSDVEEERKKEMRKLEFKEHRKRHYNEMELVKKFRQEHPDDALDVGDDDDGGGDDRAAAAAAADDEGDGDDADDEAGDGNASE